MQNLFLFVTANNNEKEAFEKFFKFESKKYVKGKSYKIGKFGLYDAAYIHIDEQGTENPYSTPIVGELIREINPVGVVMVGIAFGFDESTQKIGDVLVSKKILSYNAEKIKENESIYKEDPKEVGFQLYNAFSDDEDWKYYISETECSQVHKGAILTGSKLINNRGFKEKLLNDFKHYKPIGGEMESYGIYSMCKIHSVSEWIIVKGICDWAYDKDNNKEENQKIASVAAVDFCHHVFLCKGIFDGLIKLLPNTTAKGDLGNIDSQISQKILLRQKLRAEMMLILLENQQIFECYGPTSSNRDIMQSECALMWDKLVIKKIIPNSQRLISLLDSQSDLLSSDEINIFEKYKMHIYGLRENHRGTGRFLLDAPKFTNEIFELLK